MYQVLLRNTAISAVVFGLTGLISLFLVPFLVTAYGIAGYGLIVLARTLLPGALLSMLDFGILEIATQAVARARADGDWSRAGRLMVGLLLSSGLLGAVVGVVLFAGSGQIATWLGVEPPRSQFELVVHGTALALPLLFAALAGDGAIRGFEHYPLVRALEFVGSVLYAGLAIYAARTGHPYEVVALIFVGVLGVRAVAALLFATVLLRRAGVHFDRPHASDWAEIRERGQSLLNGKWLSTVRDHAVAPLIGWWAGPAAVGLFDVLTRIPRFVKSTLGLLNSALLPFAARLDFGGQHDQLQQLGRIGLSLTSIVVVPICAAGALYSLPLMNIWVGADVAEHWLWQALMFAVPAFSALLGFASTSLMTRVESMQRLNKIALLQTVILFGVGFALFPWLRERSFIAGTVLGAAIAFPLQAGVVLPQLGVSKVVSANEPMRALTATVFICALLAAIVWLAGVLPLLRDWPTLIVVGGIWTVVATGASFMTGFPAAWRARLITMAVGMLRNRPG